MALIAVELPPKFILGDETTRLPDDDLQGAAVQLPMPGDGERLRGSRGRYTPQFHVTPSLGMNQKAEPAENSHHIVAGEPFTVRCLREATGHLGPHSPGESPRRGPRLSARKNLRDSIC
jgi:hypothetical protein